MEITIPFPPSILRPNNKSHWRVKNPIKAAYRDRCFTLAALHNGVFNGYKGRIKTTIMFYTPNRRWDADAMLSALKSGLDGTAKGMGVNDRQFRPFTFDDENCPKDPRVVIRFEQEDSPARGRG